MANLEIELGEELKKSSKGLPTQFVNFAIKKVIENGNEAKPMQVGDKFSEGKLINHLDKSVVLSKLLAGRPAIISFYRGAWCPYCNLELRHYDNVIAENKKDEILLFAISPEKPDVTMETVDIEKLHFQVLSDVDSKFAKKLGLVYKLSLFLKLFTRIKGGNLKKSQGNTDGELPIPATYIIDSNRIIKHAWLDSDFTKRAEPAEVISAYKQLLKK